MNVDQVQGAWSKTGLLRGLSSQQNKRIVAILMENQRLFNQTLPDWETIAAIKRISLPLARRTIGNILENQSWLTVIPSTTIIPDLEYLFSLDHIVCESSVLNYTNTTHATNLDYECDLVATLSENLARLIQETAIKNIVEEIPPKPRTLDEVLNEYTAWEFVFPCEFKGFNYIIVPRKYEDSFADLGERSEGTLKIFHHDLTEDDLSGIVVFGFKDEVPEKSDVVFFPYVFAAPNDDKFNMLASFHAKTKEDESLCVVFNITN